MSKETKRHKTGEELAIEEAERQSRLTDLHDTIVVQVATLAELSHLLVEMGLDEDARLARKVVIELGREGDVIVRVRDALPYLQRLTARMGEIGTKQTKQFRKALEHMRKALVARCDVTLLDTNVEIRLPDDPTDKG
jgi:hypothetical protein